MKLCQGPKCHEHKTKDRIRGSKGDKHYETRKRSNLVYGNFCSLGCQDEWFVKFDERAVDHFGRIHEPKRQDASNAWYKDYKWQPNNQHIHYIINDLLGERRPITEQQYQDENFVSP